jgi:hypothetical protein
VWQPKGSRYERTGFTETLLRGEPEVSYLPCLLPRFCFVIPPNIILRGWSSLPVIFRGVLSPFSCELRLIPVGMAEKGVRLVVGGEVVGSSGGGVGDSVGSGDGLADEVAAGVVIGEGNDIGESIGAGVGVGRGEIVGAGVGDDAGVSVGEKVGFIEGVAVGIDDGVGVSVAEDVGSGVGDRVGSGVVDEVGWGVGDRADTGVGDEVGSCVGEGIGGVGGVVAVGVWKEVGAAVGEEIEFGAIDGVGAGVEEGIGLGVGDDCVESGTPVVLRLVADCGKTYKYGQKITVEMQDPDFGSVSQKIILPDSSDDGTEKSYEFTGSAFVEYCIKVTDDYNLPVEGTYDANPLTVTRNPFQITFTIDWSGELSREGIATIDFFIKEESVTPAAEAGVEWSGGEKGPIDVGPGEIVTSTGCLFLVIPDPPPKKCDSTTFDYDKELAAHYDNIDNGQAAQDDVEDALDNEQEEGGGWR